MNSFRKLYSRAVLFCVGAWLGGVGMAAGLLLDSWQQRANSLETLALERNLAAEVGYGGFIHHFKNYVIRHDDADRRKALLNYDRFLILLDEVEARSSVRYDAVRQTLAEYVRNLEVARDHIARGATTEALEARIAVDNSAALREYAEVSSDLKHMMQGYITRGRLAQYIGALGVILSMLASAGLAGIALKREKADAMA